MDTTKLFDHIYNETIRCTQCNLCILGCPMFMGSRRDYYSPRALVILLREASEKKIFDKHLVDLIMLCNFCANCNVRCPAKIDITALVRKTREYLMMQ